MKLKLLLLFLLPILVEAQIPMKPVREWVNQTTEPPNFTSGTLGDIAIYTGSKSVYEYYKSSGTPNSTRWRKITDQATIDFYCNKATGTQGPKGDTGATGPAGRDGVCPNCPPLGNGGSGSFNSPFYYVNTNGVDDAATLQMFIDSSYITGKNIFLVSNLKMSRGVKIAKDHKRLSVEGWAEITSTNTGAWTFFYSDVPANTGEAEGVYTMRRLNFSKIILKGQGQAQTGFDLMASEGANYEFIWGYDMKCVINVTFGLRTRLDYIEANGSIDGIKIISGVGRWANATNSNSCSNGCTINSYRCYAAQNTNTALIIESASNTVINYIVIEGFKVNIGIQYDAMSTTSTGLECNNIHYECAQVAGVAVIKIRSSTMSHYINAPAFGKQSVFVMVEAVSGYPNVTLSNISSNRIYWNGVDKIFNNSGGNWTFQNCDDPLRSTDELKKMFAGTPVTTNGGPNSVRITLPIAR